MDFGQALQAFIGLYSMLESRGQAERAQRLLQRSLDEFGNISLPKLPQIVAEELGPSAMESIDPRLDAAQHEALGAYDEVIDGGGFAQADRAALNNVGNSLSRRLRATRQGISDSMAARGLEGSGADYAAQANAAQDAEQRLSVAGENTAAEGLRRRMAAIAGKGQMSGEMWDRAARKAAAKDEIERFNATARSGANAYNSSIPQQEFQNALTKAAGKAGRIGAMVGQQNTAGGIQRMQLAGMGAAAGRLGGAYGGSDYGQASKNKSDPGGYYQKRDADGYAYDSEPEEWENPWA